ncbi:MULTISPECIES: 3,4-dihydroxy-2-butanone-4-phosphate synthase [Enterococcus]|uniref:3,4-dihydroxy-2-butanone-4-phosphate synthase n=1 Tax=Enterococcus TaxID=1350 RepID=UPI0026796271
MAIDLARLTGSVEATYICKILNEDGTIACLVDLRKLADEWYLSLLTIDDLADYVIKEQLISVALPTKYGDFDLELYEHSLKREKLLLSKGDVRIFLKPLLVRLHSDCFTDDVSGFK